VIGWIKRRRALRGTMPQDVRAELEAEGIELLEEKIEGNVVYRRYSVAGQRPTSGDQNITAALALTPKRLVMRATLGVSLDAPPGVVRSEVVKPGWLELKYEAGDLFPTRSGSVEIALETPRAADIHARLQAWNQTSTS
jgi:hypothetical protein